MGCASGANHKIDAHDCSQGTCLMGRITYAQLKFNVHSRVLGVNLPKRTMMIAHVRLAMALGTSHLLLM
jgi:hypothetical protein